MNTTTTNTKKPTKAQRFNEIRALIPADRADLIEFVDHELSLLDKKNRADRKPTAKEMETANLRDELIAILTDAGAPMSVTEIMLANETFGAMSNQRVTALMKGLLDDGKVARTVEKRIAKFSIVA